MTSNELKHQAKVQKWGLAIQDCRSSGLSVREWCRQRGITPTTYYRWEREVLSGIGRKDAEGRSGGTFVELPAPQPLRNNSERAATLNIGSSSIDLYQEMGPELLRTLVELLRQCWTILPEQTRSTSPVDIQICAKGSMVWPRWYSSSLNWTHSPTHCFCSAGESGTE